MAILFSLLAAAGYGLSDFVGGLVSQRVTPWAIALVSQLGGAALFLVGALLVDGTVTADTWRWTVLAGLGNGLGTAFLYRGLSTGRMGVVAPVSGVGAALVPVGAGLLLGERPGAVVWLGIVAAIPAIWLVARVPTGADGPTRTGLGDAVLAGLGFGTLFAALAQVPESAGLLPLAVNQLIGAAVVVGVAQGLREAWLPRRPVALVGLVCGILGAAGTGLFLLATRDGLLTVSAVITSLYPAFTVVLAAGLLHERVHRAQAAGLGLCAVAVVLVAVG
ncbi:EamA family transporter [Nocardioides sp.]|uniref:EamA family transporter n=1 Tax=Nocardioides sp. TaxID=35761 RepID=UPI00286A5803|nr:EamA family transporter [Nocardioides sp.]